MTTTTDTKHTLTELSHCAKRLAAILETFVSRAGRVGDSHDPLHCVYESDVTATELREAHAALDQYNAADYAHFLANRASTTGGVK